MRKYRIFRLWFYGRIKLAQRISKKIFMHKLYEKCKQQSLLQWKGVNPENFQQKINDSQTEFFKNLLQKLNH